MSYILLLLALASCGTGIESTTAVSEKQARKELAQYKGPKAVPSLRLEPDSVAHWKAGKQFYVTDDQVSLIFTHELLAAVRAGQVTPEKAVTRLEEIRSRLDEDAEESPFDTLGGGETDYIQVGDDEPLAMLLDRAIANLKETFEQ